MDGHRILVIVKNVDAFKLLLLLLLLKL